MICSLSNKQKGGPLLTKETRTVKFDAELKIEAYHFQGIMQKVSHSVPVGFCIFSIRDFFVV